MDLCVLQHVVQVLPLEPEACSSPGAHSPQAPCLLSTTAPCLGLCRCHHGAVSKHRLWSTALMHRPWRIKSIRQSKARWIAWWLQRTVHTEHTRMEPDVLISLWHISCLTVLWAAMRWCWEWGQERSTQTEQREEQNSVPIKRAHCFKNRKQAIVYRIRSRLSPEPHVCSTLQQYVHDCMKKKKWPKKLLKRHWSLVSVSIKHWGCARQKYCQDAIIASPEPHCEWAEVTTLTRLTRIIVTSEAQW